MDNFGLLSISVTAFSVVFLLLGFLAVMMRLILTVFPQNELPLSGQQKEAVDAAMIAAITRLSAEVFPGAHITKIEVTK